jgi:hypothetical protein
MIRAIHTELSHHMLDSLVEKIIIVIRYIGEVIAQA